MGQKRSKDLRPYVMLHSFIIFRTWTHTSCYGNSIYIYVSRELLLRLHMTWMVESWRDIQRSKLLQCVHKRRKCAFCADGARAWQTAAKSFGISCYQVSHQFRQYCKNIFDPSIAQLPKKAGPQCLDADWTSLKTGQPNQIKRKQKSNETSKVNPRLVNRCYQCCWRRSLDNLPPGKFLKEL